MKNALYGKSNSELELLKCYSTSDLLRGIHSKEKINYSENGNRTQPAEKTLKLLNQKYKTVGVTRIAEISQLVDIPYPVFQAVRPNIFSHFSTGQNTGSQGKGPTKVQAQISAIMESIEAYCAEPKNISLIRGSYDFLSLQHAIIPPDSFFPFPFTEKVKRDEPLMWTQAFHVESNQEVLIPAEEVYFPFFSKDYKTKTHFPMTSNGLAAGVTYLEAINHALYEVIERYYLACREVNTERIAVDKLEPNEFLSFLNFKNKSKRLFKLDIYSIRFLKGPNLPCILVSYVKDGQGYLGFSCAPTFEMAVSRAMSEAAQSAATHKSGMREDMGEKKKRFNKFKSRMTLYEVPLPFEKTISKGKLSKIIKEKKFKTLNSEFKYLIKWLQARGFNNVCIANLTRKGIDVPVVKVVVPAMAAWFHHLDTKVLSSEASNFKLYRLKK